MFGPTNREVGKPSWMCGAFEVGEHLTITYNRLWIIVFTGVVFVALLAILRFTRLGLEMRAVTQNRRMAARDGHPHRAGRRADIRARLRHRRPRRRRALADRQRQRRTSARATSSTAFWSWCSAVSAISGARLVGALTLGIANKFLEPFAGAVLGKIAILVLHHPVHPEAAARAVRPQGQGGGSMNGVPAHPAARPRRGDLPGAARRIRDRDCRSSICCCRQTLCRCMSRPISSRCSANTSATRCWRLSIDLIWGYAGILSLGHGAFFALGGYAMGMYLMRQIGTRGVYANPVLPDFMVFLNWPELPLYWYGFDHFAYATLMVVLVPGVLAFVFGWFAFRSRVTGVYLSIITQALTFALMLGFFRNDFGFGGNNGLTDFKDILGFNVQARRRRATRCSSRPVLRSALAFLICRAIVTSKLGKVLIAIRDAEIAYALPRLSRRDLQAVRLHAVGLHGRHCRRALRAAGRHHQSGRIRSGQLDRGRHLGRSRRPRHADRRCARRRSSSTTPRPSSPRGLLAPYWLFVLGALFIVVTLFLPRGIVGTLSYWRADPRRAKSTRMASRTLLPRRQRSDEHDRSEQPPPRCSISTASASRSTASRRSTSCRS